MSAHLDFCGVFKRTGSRDCTCAGGTAVTRMCSCCRKPIANGTESLILNGMYAHVECIAMAMREPWSMEQVTDDQLRAECERRGFTRGPRSAEVADLRERLHEYKREVERRDELLAGAEADRDEWKRRAEAAEAELVDPRRTIRIATDGDLVELGSVHDCGRLELVVTRRDNETLPGRNFLVAQVERESGPGIAAKPLTARDEPAAFLDEDLLCEDA